MEVEEEDDEDGEEDGMGGYYYDRQDYYTEEDKNNNKTRNKPKENNNNKADEEEEEERTVEANEAINSFVRFMGGRSRALDIMSEQEFMQYIVDLIIRTTEKRIINSL